MPTLRGIPMEPADADSIWGLDALPTNQRVGVPGGKQLSGGWADMFRWQGTVWSHSCNVAVLLHVILYFSMANAYYYMTNHGLHEHAKIDGGIMGPLSFITTFALGGYMSTILGRYHERFNNCCQTNGNMTLISLLSGSQLKNNVVEAATIVRWAHLMMHMNYMMTEGAITARKWRVLRERGLVTEDEMTELKALAKKPSAVYVWTSRLIFELCEQKKLSPVHAQRLEECLSGARGLSAKQIGYKLTPIPLPYFSLMSVIINVFIILVGWNSAVRMVDGIEDTFTALHSDYADYDVSRVELSAMMQNVDVLGVAATEFAGFIVIVLAFNVMRKIAEDLTNPYGNDHTDYSLDNDLLNSWVEAKETIKNMQANGGDLASRMIKAATKPNDGYVTADLKFEEDGDAGAQSKLKVTAPKSGVPALV